MSFTNQTTHYGLPQWIGSDKPTYLVDQNNAYQTIDSELYNANTASGEAVTTAQGAVTTAEGAASTAATALSTAQGAETTATTADGKADNAITLAQSAQTAAGAAQTAAEAAQEAAAGNSITNLANAYDPTLTYNVGDLVTQDGKLYQCITQVSTPEAFDINKWDDKTVSEVFNHTDYLLVGVFNYLINANTHTTYADAISWIATHGSDIFNLSAGEIATNVHINLGALGPVFNNIQAIYDQNTPLAGIFVGIDFGADRAKLIGMDVIADSPKLRDIIMNNSGNTFTDLTSNSQSAPIRIYWTKYVKA